tara:strand:+ start:1694 stop:2632 length:939 start_codon:yes stop_codon:yes gene_type:complete
MTEPVNSTPFIKASIQDQYGKKPPEIWIGKVVGFDSQKDQIENGWGWRYKVRIMGDNSDVDNVTDDQLSYAYSSLPTTAGSGGAYKLRSVRISQGDTVHGIRGHGGPLTITGVFPRTRNTILSDAPFGTKSGFYGDLEDNGIISGEFNEQVGPATPGGVPLINKSNRENPKDKVSEIGYDPNDAEIITDTQEKTNAKKNKTVMNVQNWVPGMPLTSELLTKLENAAGNNEIDPEFYALALPQAVKQGLIDGDTAKVKEVTNRLKKDLLNLKTNIGDVDPETIKEIQKELESASGIDMTQTIEDLRNSFTRDK